MAQYRILVFCTACSRTHPVKRHISLDDGPSQKKTVADAYQRKRLPLPLAKVLRKDILCPELAAPVMLEDSGKVYLVPID